MTPEQMRVLCRHLIDTMPDDGLEETLTTLRDYLDFYLKRKAAGVVAVAREQSYG